MDARPTPVGKLIDQLVALRDKKRKLEEQKKAIEAEFAEIEKALDQRLQAENLDKSTGKTATVSFKDELVANVDWDKAWPLIVKNPQLMIRNLNQGSFRELYGIKGEKFMAKYGFTPFTKRKMSLRSL